MMLILILLAILQREIKLLLFYPSVNLTGWLQVRYKSDFIILSYHNVLLSKTVTPAERSCHINRQTHTD